MEKTTLKPVFLQSEKCNGCVSCMKRCPTEAIRVRDGKATVMYDRCIACGECVRICPTKAKNENFDSFYENFDKEKYNIAIVSSSVFGQFSKSSEHKDILQAVKNLGFDLVFDTGIGAEYVSTATKQYIENKKLTRPVISSKCPAVISLILLRYENLAKNLSTVITPEKATAIIAKNYISTKNIQKEINVTLITQCSSHLLYIKNSINSELINNVVSIKEVYKDIVINLGIIQSNKKTITQNQEDFKISKNGYIFSYTGGETKFLKNIKTISCDGVENITHILEKLENENLAQLDFIELNMCSGGCVGGSQNIENPYFARARIKPYKLISPKGKKIANKVITKNDIHIQKPYAVNNIFKLSEDRPTALKMAIKVQDIYQKLPQIDCGACGAPSCKALAEDVVKGLKVKCKYNKD